MTDPVATIDRPDTAAEIGTDTPLSIADPMVAEPGEREFDSIKQIALDAFPTTFELESTIDESGREWAPVSVTWQTLLPITLLVKMGCGIKVLRPDGSYMDTETWHRLIAEREVEMVEAQQTADAEATRQ